MRRLSALVCCLMMLAMPVLAEGQRGAFVLRPSDGSQPVRMYLRSYALVIGNDAYRAGWPRLSNAVADARAVAAELEARGFQVTVRTDLDSRALEDAVEDFVYDRGEEESARLLIWYAGHGHMIGEEAYLVPVDAPPPGAGNQFRRMAMSMRDFGKFMREVESRHVLAIFDSCFSGNVFEITRAAPNPAVTRATALPVRQLITAGEAGQTVSDDGTFRKLFIAALEGEEPAADANGDGYLTGSELGLFLADKVTTLSLGRQTPRYGKLRELGFDRGDFVFELAGAKAAPAVQAAAPAFLAPQAPAVAAPSFLAPQAPAAKAPEPAALARQAVESRFEMEGNQSLLLMENRLLVSMTGTPTGGRGDLVGLRVNDTRVSVAIGNQISVDGPGDGCQLTLLQIFKGKNRAEFLLRCGERASDEARKAAKLKLDVPAASPRTVEAFRMAGGASNLLGPSRSVVSMTGTPTGGRGDLVGMVVDGKRKALSIGERLAFGPAEQDCGLMVTTIHKGQNQADFLLICP